MNESILSTKLDLQSGQRGFVMNAPRHYLDALEPLPDQFLLSSRPNGVLDVAVLFVKSTAELEHNIGLLAAGIRETGTMWVAFPRKSTLLAAALTTERTKGIIHQAGLEMIARVSLDSSWDAVGFRPSPSKKASRPATPRRRANRSKHEAEVGHSGS